MRIKAPRNKKEDHREKIPVAVSLPVYFNLAQPVPDPGCTESLVLGALGRFGAKTPKASAVLLQALRNFTRRTVERLYDRLEPGDADFETWIETTPYPAARREELKKLWNEDPFDPDRVKDSTKIKSFMKDEGYGSAYKLPRPINSRSDHFKCYCGPLFDAIGKQFFYNTPEMIKTVPVLDRPEDIMSELHDSLAPILNMDATSFEAHFIEEVMTSIEFEFYDYMCEAVPEYKRRMEIIKEVLSGEQVLQFKQFIVELIATRMSGEMNTSLGNGFTTYTLTKFLAFVKRVIARLRAEGDDNASIWQFIETIPTDQEYNELGWIMKIERPKKINEASFCGQVFDVDDLVVVTNIVEALVKFGWTNKRYVNASENVRLQLLKSKALSLAHQYNGCPILGPLGRHIVKLTSNVRIRESIINNVELYKREQLRNYIKLPLPEEKKIGDATRQLVEKLYGITVEEQISFEEQIPTITLWSCVEYPFVHPRIYDEHFDRYSAPVGEHWAWSGRRHDAAVKQAILSYGKITKDFTTAFYRA